jgi:hypothetical protein
VIPEAAIAMILPAILGWGAFSWRKSEQAIEIAQKANERVDAVELKMAEDYLSKLEFREQMNQLFATLSRFENKIDKIADYNHELMEFRLYGWRNTTSNDNNPDG